MKIVFLPSKKPWYFLSSNKLKLVNCPECGSVNVWTHTIVNGRGWVHLNTGEVEDIEDGEADIEDARNEEDRLCNDCHHEWNA